MRRSITAKILLLYMGLGCTVMLAPQKYQGFLFFGLLVGLGTVGMMISLRQTRSLGRWTRGRCMACGYDLRGSAGRCPECGTPRHGRWR